MNIGIVGIGIAITFAIIALSAVTLYLAFRVKETFREDTGFKGQITKIGFILGILFLAGGVFYFGAAAIVKPNMINYNKQFFRARSSNTIHIKRTNSRQWISYVC